VDRAETPEEGSSGRDAGDLQNFFRALLTPPFRFLWRVTTEGLGNLPETGGAIIAPNHISVLDSFFVPLTLPRRITYVGKAEYMDDWKTKWLFPAMGMVPIDRSGGDSANAALNTAARILESGELFGIYPEGTRSRTGKLHKGHTGVARLALRTMVPIIPVGIIGSNEIQPPDSRMPKPFRRVHIRFGTPIDVTKYADRADDRLILRQIADEIMYEIRKLTGQDYEDTYATKPATRPGLAPVIPLPRPAADADRAEEAVLEGAGPAEAVPMEAARPAAFAASAVAHPEEQRRRVRRELEGDERRSSAAVLKVRPLEPA
jgi:1-acyl-sn-glycerol-3-phosphate acyltransferase